MPVLHQQRRLWRIKYCIDLKTEICSYLVLNSDQVQTWQAMEIPWPSLPSGKELHLVDLVVAVQSTIP